MFENITIEKGLYSVAGKSFTEALSELDPDEMYTGTEYEGLDAFERQLKRFDIKVKGADCDRVEKFFTSTQSAVLFPEYVRRTIKQGLDEASILPLVTAATTYTDSIDYRGLTAQSSGSVAGVAEGGELPVTNVRLAASASPLTKFARKISCSYESIRKQRLEAFAVILRNMGAEISRAINKAACDALKSGLTATEIGGAAITYAELASFWASLENHEMTTLIATPAAIAEIAAMEQMKCCTGINAEGRPVTPFGLELVKCTNLGENIAIGIDKTAALEMVYGTDVVVDFDKLISTQCEEIAASIMVGFSKLTEGAVKTIKTA